MVGPVGIDGVPTPGLTVTAIDSPGEEKQELLATTLMVAAPEKAALQVTVPVVPDPLMVPAKEGLIDQA